ncbi:MAG: hypothetical protein IIU86_03580 [Oscillospiraceae bacterium]|nr:hypothetical protein [Oscillospiraceae bacterium]
MEHCLKALLPLLGGNEMVKLYFKKLLFTLLFIFEFPILSGVCMFFWHLIFRYMFPESVGSTVCIILGALLALILVYLYRCERSSIKTDYISSFSSDTFSFIEDFKSTFKSKENIVHTSAFLTIELIVNLAAAISTNTPFLPLVIGNILLLFVGGLIFSILNTLLWCLVHKRWVRY